MQLRLKRGKGISVTEQIVEEIRYAIATGQLKQGEKIPPGRVLAQELGVHPNTVFAAYRRLEREGLLKLRQGSGAYVVSFPTNQLKRSAKAKLERSLSEILELVQLGLIDPDELKRTIEERLQNLLRLQVAPKVAFVECNFEQMETCCRQLEQALGVKVEPILLDDAKRDENKLRSFDLIVTTFFHFREVSSFAGRGRKVIPVLSVPSQKALRSIANLPLNARVGVICRDKVSVPIIVQQVRQISGVEPILAAWLGDRRGVRKVLNECDAIVYMPPCRSRVLASAPKGKTLIEFEHEIDPNSLEEVRQVFGRTKSNKTIGGDKR